MRYRHPGEEALGKKVRAFVKNSGWAKGGLASIFHGELMMFSWGTDQFLHVYNDAVIRFPKKVLEALKALYPDKAFRIEDGKLFLDDHQLKQSSGMPCTAIPYSYDKIWTMH